ncbi:MAG: hypothetical protein N3A72_03250 [bacterium]|nr:hypothetical protein [bacterium]
MSRKLVTIGILITVGVLVYLYFPRENVIGYFSDSINPIKQQEKKLATNTTQAQPNSQQVYQPSQPQSAPLGKPISEYLKIRRMADENQVQILSFDELQIGTVTMRLRARDKNDIFNFIDAIERGINLRDIENISKGYKIMYDNDGRQIVEAVIWIRYIPRYQ